MGLNRYEVMGAVGKEPEIKSIGSNNTKVARFSVATNEYAGKKDGKAQYKTEWHDLEVWGKSAEYVEAHIHKGDTVFASGRKETQSWGEGDNKKSKVLLVIGLNGRIERVKAAGEGNANGNNGGGNSSGGGQAAPADDVEIPF
jgi:single-strand DNA-binding protein